MELKIALIDGIPMRWHESGDGTPLVLIHGIPTGPELWRDVVRRLNGVRCLAWEMVGYAGSIPAGVDRDISIGQQANYVLRWLDHLGIDRAILAGHDLGGGVAQIAAVRHPHRCMGLFLTNAIGYDSWPIPSVKAMRAFAPTVQRMPDVLFKQVMRTFLLRGHDHWSQAAAAFDRYWPYYAEQGGAEAFARQVRSLDVADTLAVADQLPQLEVPARIVWGAADRYQKLRYGERFARDLKAPLRRIEGGHHFTPEDHSEVIAQELQRLVEALGVSTGAAVEPWTNRSLGDGSRSRPRPDVGPGTSR